MSVATQEAFWWALVSIACLWKREKGTQGQERRQGGDTALFTTTPRENESEFRNKKAANSAPKPVPVARRTEIPGTRTSAGWDQPPLARDLQRPWQGPNASFSGAGSAGQSCNCQSGSAGRKSALAGTGSRVGPACPGPLISPFLRLSAPRS